jgi:phosphate transport system substrate-binding protein
MSIKSKRLISCCLVTSIWVMGACSPNPDSDLAVSRENESITISGAWALYPLVVTWAEEFQVLYPDIRFDISAGGAGKGMTDVLANAVDIGMVSREIYPEEADKGALGFPVARDAVFLTINAENPVWEELKTRGITRETLVGIYIEGDVTTWGEVIGMPEITDPIHLFTRSDAAGAPATWAAYLGGAQEDLLGIGVYGDPGVMEAVIRDPLGLGYNNLNYAYDPSSGEPIIGARVVPIDADENGMIDAGETILTKDEAIRAVSSGRYPSPPARDLYLVTNGEPSGATSMFIRWALTTGQQSLDKVGYVPIPLERITSALDLLN